jgi:hypothetical protein
VSVHGVDDVIFRVADALQVPVLVLALAALALVIVEAGAFAVELRVRGRRSVRALESAVAGAHASLATGNRVGATAALREASRASPRRWPTSTTAASGGSSARGCSSARARHSASWAR